MLKNEEKTSRNIILDKLRENSLDKNWLKNQLDSFEKTLEKDPEIVILNEIHCIYDPLMELDGPTMKKINNKQFTDIDSIQKILSEFYSDFLDEDKIKKETELLLGFTSDIDKEGCRDYNFTAYYLKSLIKSISHKGRMSPTHIDYFFKEIRIKKNSKLQQFDFSKFLKGSELDKLIHLQHRRWYACPEFFIKVYYNLEKEEIVFRKEEGGNQIYLGDMRISVTPYGKRTPLLKSVLSNDKEKFRNRFKIEIEKLIRQFYLKSYKKETSVTDVLLGDAVSELLLPSTFNDYVENSIKELKEFFNACTHRDKERILEIIKNDIKL